MLYFVSDKERYRSYRMKNVRKAPLSLFLSILTVLCFLFPASAATGFQQKIDGFTENINAAVVYDMTAHKMIYSKNEKAQISIASTTKLVTALVALEITGPDTVITVGDEISLIKPHSSISQIRPGHRLKLRTLIAAMLLPSGNDAAYTVAVNAARIHAGNSGMKNEDAVKYFCNLMNEYVRKLGCKNTYFVNPEGWDNTNHFSTAEDMTKVAIQAANNAIIASIANLHQNKFYFASGENITWTNSNELLNPNSKYYYSYAHGLKTGTTNAAGKCLIAFAEKDGRQLLVLAYGCKEETDRFGRVRDIFEYVYSAPVLGDVDESGTISANDARLILRISVGLEPVTDVIKSRGDINNDGKLAAYDARMVLRASVGLEDLSAYERAIQ